MLLTSLGGGAGAEGSAASRAQGANQRDPGPGGRGRRLRGVGRAGPAGRRADRHPDRARRRGQLGSSAAPQTVNSPPALRPARAAARRRLVEEGRRRGDRDRGRPQERRPVRARARRVRAVPANAVSRGRARPADRVGRARLPGLAGPAHRRGPCSARSLGVGLAAGLLGLAVSIPLGRPSTRGLTWRRAASGGTGGALVCAGRRGGAGAAGGACPSGRRPATGALRRPRRRRPARSRAGRGQPGADPRAHRSSARSRWPSVSPR